ncbi:MAG: endo-1,4-beta-xylanase [Polyangiaceae bacterium]|nr:endo-1,4-beta-xylanase [Polyangiaceae bacterium]
MVVFPTDHQRAWIDCSGSASPLLWDNNFQKKPAYTAVLDALTGR